MILARLKTVVMETVAVLERVREASRRSLARGGEAVRDAARNSIQRSQLPSQPGQPPHSQTGRLPDSIGTFAEGDAVVIGPALLASGRPMRDAEPVPAQLEQTWPFMGPALAEVGPRLPSFWANSVKGDQ